VSAAHRPGPVLLAGRRAVVDGRAVCEGCGGPVVPVGPGQWAHGREPTAFLTAGLVDELQVVVAPLVVGDPAAPRLAAAAVDRMELVDLRRVGDCALLVYHPPQP